MTAAPADVRRVLVEARALLVRDGWRTSQLGPLDARVHARRCASGAICAAACDLYEEAHDDSDWDARHALRRAAGLDAIGSIPQWNDAQPDVAPVLAAFDRAIASLTEAES